MKTIFEPRHICFLALYHCNLWRIKVYSISFDASQINETILNTIKANLETWLLKAEDYPLPTYKIATLIIHKWKGGHFAIINWWIDENMLQLLVYLAPNETPTNFQLYSDRGMISCVWELEILWFERNAWVNEVLKKEINPTNIDNYLAKVIN